jgi:hypothetical protein
MKKKYLAVILLLIICSIAKVNALTIDNCEVLASYKLYSSLDEENYICKGKEYGSSIDAIYYSGNGSKIVLNNFNAYYFTNWDEYDLTIDISGNNNISMLDLSDSKFTVTGSGTLKFKQNSFVKKFVNGEPVYQYVYKDKTVLNSDKKIYEGKQKEFEESYEHLKEINKLPNEYNLDDYVLVQVADYTKMTSVTVTVDWIKQHINTSLEIDAVEGFGIVKYVKPEAQKAPESSGDKNNNQLETDNVILITDKNVNTEYELKEENLTNHEVAIKVSNTIEKDLVSLYDVSVYNGKKQVPMKDGQYTMKIKLDNNIDKYENYQIIYVNDNGEIEEYIDAKIEDGYIVFNTSHLSQYGVIANPIENNMVSRTNIYRFNPIIGNIFKVSVLVIFIIGAACLVGILLYKNYTLSSKKRKKRA